MKPIPTQQKSSEDRFHIPLFLPLFLIPIPCEQAQGFQPFDFVYMRRGASLYLLPPRLGQPCDDLFVSACYVKYPSTRSKGSESFIGYPGTALGPPPAARAAFPKPALPGP